MDENEYADRLGLGAGDYPHGCDVCGADWAEGEDCSPGCPEDYADGEPAQTFEPMSVGW